MEILQCTNCQTVVECGRLRDKGNSYFKERDECDECNGNGYLMNPDDETYEVVHKGDVRVGDAILFQGQFKTINSEYIKHGFMGTTLFGDSFKLGIKQVLRLKSKRY